MSGWDLRRSLIACYCCKSGANSWFVVDNALGFTRNRPSRISDSGLARSRVRAGVSVEARVGIRVSASDQAAYLPCCVIGRKWDRNAQTMECLARHVVSRPQNNIPMNTSNQSPAENCKKTRKFRKRCAQASVLLRGSTTNNFQS